MKEVAIIGPTASGKSALAIEVAQRTDAYILSIDSLSIYKEIDIVSAKPSREELEQVRHFGIDVLKPDEYFSIERFIPIYQEAKRAAQADEKNLIIVGGTVFYLKTLLSGLSPMPLPNEEAIQKSKELLRDLPKAYEFLNRIDPEFTAKITKSDRYRIEKGLLLYFSTGEKPSDYFRLHPPKPIIKELPIFNIHIDRSALRNRVEQRTYEMIEAGLIDEIYGLEKKYTRKPNPMKAIGIKETFEYLDGKVDLQGLYESIVNHTMQLAKRQRTFIRSQLPQAVNIGSEDVAVVAQALKPA